MLDPHARDPCDDGAAAPELPAGAFLFWLEGGGLAWAPPWGLISNVCAAPGTEASATREQKMIRPTLNFTRPPVETQSSAGRSTRKCNSNCSAAFVPRISWLLSGRVGSLPECGIPILSMLRAVPTCCDR